MQTIIKAKFENGIFYPLEKVNLEDGTEIILYIKKLNKNKISEFGGIWKNDNEIEQIMKKIIEERNLFSKREVSF